LHGVKGGGREPGLVEGGDAGDEEMNIDVVDGATVVSGATVDDVGAAVVKADVDEAIVVAGAVVDDVGATVVTTDVDEAIVVERA
jgi:hypothetical protein